MLLIGGGPGAEIPFGPSRPARDARGARQSHARSPIAKDPRQQPALQELLLCMGRTDQSARGVWGWKPIVDHLREPHPSCGTRFGSEKNIIPVWVQVRQRLLLLPVLRILRDKREHVARAAAHLALSDASAARNEELGALCLTAQQSCRRTEMSGSGSDCACSDAWNE